MNEGIHEEKRKEGKMGRKYKDCLKRGREEGRKKER